MMGRNVLSLEQELSCGEKKVEDVKGEWKGCVLLVEDFCFTRRLRRYGSSSEKKRTWDMMLQFSDYSATGDVA